MHGARIAIVVLVASCGPADGPGSNDPDAAPGANPDGATGGEDAFDTGAPCTDGDVRQVACAPGVSGIDEHACVGSQWQQTSSCDPTTPHLSFAGWPISEVPALYQAGAVLRDDTTGLMWSPNPSTALLTHAQAISFCDELTVGGYTDWRVPRIVELFSVINFSAVYNHRLSALFTFSLAWAVPYSSIWTADIDDPDTLVFDVDPYVGGLGNEGPTYTRRAMCVRTQTPRAAGPQFEILGDVVRDRKTGLRWQREGTPNRLAFADAETYCAGLVLGGISSWTLPTAKQIVTLLDPRPEAGRIDTTIFPTYVAYDFGYWTSSNPARPSAEDPERFVLLFGGGDLRVQSLVNPGSTIQVGELVRCVATP